MCIHLTVVSKTYNLGLFFPHTLNTAVKTPGTEDYLNTVYMWGVQSWEFFFYVFKIFIYNADEVIFVN